MVFSPASIEGCQSANLNEIPVTLKHFVGFYLGIKYFTDGTELFLYSDFPVITKV